MPFATAALGHASATTTLRHYARVFDAARLETGASMIDAIRAARAKLEHAGVYPMCTRAPAGTLRSPARNNKSPT